MEWFIMLGSRGQSVITRFIQPNKLGNYGYNS